MTSIADAVQGALRQIELEVAQDEARKIELSATEAWARDPGGWINAHVWIASKFAGKRRSVKPMRMILYPDQERTVDAWIDLELLRETGELVFRNVVIEKSRQIGETWLFAALLCWALHYHAATGLAMHQRAAEIADRGWSVKSLFGKIRYIDRRLDRNVVPGLGRLVYHPFSTDPAKVVNETNGHVLHGECQRDDPGRGGTFDYALVDEAPFVRHGEAVHAALDEAVEDGIAALGTVNGSDNFHARLADDQPEGWRYLRLHWSGHPVYSVGLHVAAIAPTSTLAGRHARQPTQPMADAANACDLCRGTIRGDRWQARAPRAHRFPGRLVSPYYDRAVVGKTQEAVAAELDIDREGSLRARVFDEFSSEVHVHRDAGGREAPIRFDPLLPLELGFDYGLDCTSVVICQDAPTEYRIIGEVELVDRPGETPTPPEVARHLRIELEELGVPLHLLEPSWTRRIYARGDPAGDARSLSTGQPLTAEYRREGFNIAPPPRHLTSTVAPSIQAVKMLLLGSPKPLKVSSRCQRWIRHMAHNRWPVNSLGVRRPGATLPVDDEHNHMCLVAGTMVSTATGAVPIESVMPGMLVWTRQGLREVEAAGPTGLRRVGRLVHERGEIVATPEHPVWIVGKGWRRLDEVDPGAGDAVLVMVEVADRDVAVVAEQPADHAVPLIVVNVQATLTRGVAAASRTAAADRAHPALCCEQSLVLVGRDAVLRSEPVGAVAVAATPKPAFALPGARGAPRRVAPRSGVVRSTDRSTATLAIGGARVLEHSPIIRVESDSGYDAVVYNLSVGDDVPEFFANGLLVHNCRATAYLIVAKFPPPKAKDPGPADPWGPEGSGAGGGRNAKVYGSLLEESQPIGYDHAL